MSVPRRDGIARYPARFQLVLAANPCPCAPAHDVDCVRLRGPAPLPGQTVRAADGSRRHQGADGPARSAALMTSGEETSAQVRARVVTAARRPWSAGANTAGSPTRGARFDSAATVPA